MPVHPARCCSPLANLPVLNAVQSAPHRVGTRRSHHSLRVNQPAQAEAGSASSVAPKHHFTAAAKGMQRRDRQLSRESITETDDAVPKIWFSSKIPVCQKEKPSRLNLVPSKKTRLRTLETSCSFSPPAETKQSSKDGPGQARQICCVQQREARAVSVQLPTPTTPWQLPQRRQTAHCDSHQQKQHLPVYNWTPATSSLTPAR